MATYSTRPKLGHITLPDWLKNTFQDNTVEISIGGEGVMNTLAFPLNMIEC